MATKTASSTKKPRSKSQLFSDIAEQTELTRKQVASVFDTMASIIKKDLSKKGPETFVVPGLMKLVVRAKPATKAREGVNPFTGDKIMIKAKPASRVVRIRPMKALKAML
jgi:nucleoid DNA-binding protein